MLIADDLRSYGFPALSRDERVRAFQDLHLPPDASLSQASVIRVGQIVSATDVIVGSLRLTGTDLSLDARRIRLDTGRIQQQVRERGPLRDLFALHDRAARQLMGGAASSIPSAATPSATNPIPPLEAFEQYIKGLVAEQPATQIKFLNGALAEFPDLRSSPARALAGLHGTGRSRPRARGRAGRAGHVAPQPSGAVSRGAVADRAETLRRGLHDAENAARRTADAVALQRSGRRADASVAATPQTGKPTYFFTKATEARADESDYFFNLGYAYWLDKDVQASIYWLREAVRRNPADGDAHFVLGAALLAAGSQTEAAREKELARQLSSKYEEWTKRQAATGEAVPRGLERLALDLETFGGQRLDSALLNSAQREQRELAAFHLQRGRRLFESEQNREALAELQKAVYLSPYEAEPHLLIGRIYLRTGRPREAIDALKVSIWSQETAAARVALGQALLDTDDPEAARTEAQRALQLDPASADAKSLLSKIDQAPKKE